MSNVLRFIEPDGYVRLHSHIADPRQLNVHVDVHLEISEFGPEHGMLCRLSGEPHVSPWDVMIYWDSTLPPGTASHMSNNLIKVSNSGRFTR